MKRRTFIGALAGGIMLGKNAMAKTRVKRKGGSLKKLVVLFQRGGNDGLNTLIPIESGENNIYRNLRPNIGFAPGETRALAGQSFFGMHESLGPLHNVYNAGDLSFVHAVGYPSPDRSHFESQSFFETAVPGNALLDGWLNRYLSNTTGPGLIRGISIGYNIPQSVSGVIPVPVSGNFGNLNVDVDPDLNAAGDTAFRQMVSDAYDLTPSTGNDLVYNTGQKIFQMIDAFSTRNLNDYIPENGAQYPSTGLGNRVRHAAQMLKDDNSFLGVEVVTIDQGGYDTHSNQIASSRMAGNHANLLNDLASSMRAFYDDMGPTRMQDIIFLVVSEFGRRAYENDSSGTDHGTGSVSMIMGGGVNGQIINKDGDWPSLSGLYQGHDLNWATDFRDIYWEILDAHMGVPGSALQNIIPGHTFSSVGFMS